MKPVNEEDDEWVESYLRRAENAPTMTSDEASRLALLAQDGDQEAMSALIEAHLRVVVSTAKRYSSRGKSFGELVTSGHAGLRRAAERYRGGCNRPPFATYATWWIRQAIIRGLAAAG